MHVTLIDKKKLDNLQCYLLPAKNKFCKTDFLSHYEKTILFWHDIISSALREEKNFDIANNLNNNLFNENDEAVILFYDNNPIGLFMFHWINTENTSKEALISLQNRFPKNLLDTLFKKKLTHVMLMGQLAVHRDWRQSSAGVGISDILMEFAVRRFLESSANILLTTTRNNRRTNDLCYRHGGKKFADNAKVFQVESDIVFFERSDIHLSTTQLIGKVAHTLWATKTNGWVDMPLSFINHESSVKTQKDLDRCAHLQSSS